MQPSIYHRGWMVGETAKIAPSLPMRKLDG
jgi:hypothetical protein